MSAQRAATSTRSSPRPLAASRHVWIEPLERRVLCAAAISTYTNPVISSDFPDPGVVYADGTYYAFATNGNASNVQAARSTDLAHWTTMSDALPTMPSWAFAGRTWAPDVAVTAAGRYNLYYTAWTRSNGKQAIGVATSSNPAGPFAPAGSAPLVAQYDNGGAIDPSVFTAADGTQYLLWKNDGNAVGQDTNIYIQQLSNDGLSLVGAAPAALIKQDRPWEGNVVEGPVLWTHGGKYYLFYSANNYATSSYATGYAVSDSLRGPYTKPAGPMLATTGEVIGPGGPEVVVGPDGNDWMLYHAWDYGFTKRSLNLDRLQWTGDVPRVTPTRSPQPVPERPHVVARHIFYNDSAFDGGSALADARDDAAIATDKWPLQPGGVATFGSVTSYTRGINGVMVDVSKLPETAPALTASSFLVETAGAGDAALWSPGPAPSGVSVRRGAGDGGSDRITLTWPDGAVRNTWLRVTLQPTPSTALAAADVFSFGNLVGEAGDADAPPFRVNALDLAAVKRASNTTAAVTGRYDFNRDGHVNALDLAAVRGNYFARLPILDDAPPVAARRLREYGQPV
jgi:GH43 family beta-xylosidase